MLTWDACFQMAPAHVSPMALRCPGPLGKQGAGSGEGGKEKQMEGCLWDRVPRGLVRVLRMAASFDQCPLLMLPLHSMSLCPFVYAYLGMFWGMS